MKCPQCGHEMLVDSHRKIPLNMCYECGYIEGRPVVKVAGKVTNFQHLKDLNLNELVAFVSTGIGVDEAKLTAWLESSFQG